MSAIPDLTLDAGDGDQAADRAILRSVTYASLFCFPMTFAELRRRLMDVTLDVSELQARLLQPHLRERLAVTDGLVHPRGCEAWLDLRRQRREHTHRLLNRHRRVLRLLRAFPYVRLVALSGGCAHENATDDDVDVFLVVREGRAWSVCLALMILCKLLGVRRTLCLNYIVDEAALPLPENDVFTAAEIVGLKPLAGRSTYRRFVAANAWAAPRFPNFFADHAADSEALPEAGAPRWAERLLNLGPAPLAEAAARWLLGAYLRRKTDGYVGVVLSPHRLKLHTQDHRPRLTNLYSAALGDTGRETP